MNEQSARSLYRQKIDQMVDTYLPNGAGTINEHRFRNALDQVAQTAFSAGRSYALLNILTTDEALEEINQLLRADGRRPISRRRLLAIAKYEHDRFAVGRQISRGTWLFAREEIDNLMPVESGHRRAK